MLLLIIFLKKIFLEEKKILIRRANKDLDTIALLVSFFFNKQIYI